MKLLEEAIKEHKQALEDAEMEVAKIDYANEMRYPAILNRIKQENVVFHEGALVALENLQLGLKYDLTSFILSYRLVHTSLYDKIIVTTDLKFDIMVSLMRQFKLPHEA